jgi:hypothetical protein
MTADKSVTVCIQTIDMLNIVHLRLSQTELLQLSKGTQTTGDNISVYCLFKITVLLNEKRVF